jgi:hypothetical protein
MAFTKKVGHALRVRLRPDLPAAAAFDPFSRPQGRAPAGRDKMPVTVDLRRGIF